MIRRDSAAKLIDRRQCAPRQDIPADASQHDDDRQPEDQHDQDFAKLLFDPLLGTRLRRRDPARACLLLRVVREIRDAPPGR